MAFAKKDFTWDDEYYTAGDEVTGSYEKIAKLNEKGYIEPLTRKELQEYKKPKKEVK